MHCVLTRRGLWSVYLAVVLVVSASDESPRSTSGTKGAGIRAAFPPAVEFPVLRVSEGPRVVDTARAVRLRSDEVFSWSLAHAQLGAPKGMAVTYRSASDDELETLLSQNVATAPRSEVFRTTPEGFFNLWQLDELRTPSNAHLALLAFDVQTDEKGDAYLAVGCDGAYAVFVGDRPVKARVCGSGFRDSSDLVSLALEKGTNRITVAFETGWGKVRRSYFLHAWCAKIRFLTSLADARYEHIAAHNHPLDTAIVSTSADLRVHNGAPFFTKATAYSPEGAVLTEGAVRQDGQIDWRERAALPSIFYLAVDDGAGVEPVVIAPELAIDKLAIPAREDALGAAWSYRMRHLLSDPYRGKRVELDWVHKMANAAASNPAPTMVDNHATLWSVHPRLGSYRSEIDGSSQFFLYYFPRDHRNAVPRKVDTTTPVVILAPTVTDPVRPFIESSIMAGQTEYENWCAVADQYGCILVWPGYNEVDFGGDLAEHALLEVMAAMQKRGLGGNPTFLLGVCSSGVMATRFAATQGNLVAGIMLYSPYLLRSQMAHWTGIPATQENTPNPIADADNDLIELASRLKEIPCTILFDSGMEGHGSRGQTTTFVNAAVRAGARVEELPCPPTNEWVWGERMKNRLTLLFGNNFPKARITGGPQATVPEVTANPKTIKAALLRGFTVQHGGDPALGRWLQTWEGGYKIWRGALLPREGTGARTKLRTVVVESDPLEALLKRAEGGIARVAGVNYFGVMVDPGDPSAVLVFRSPQASGPLPVFDPLLDGLTQAQIWRQEGEAWQPVESP